MEAREAQVEQTADGATAASPGWFVVNLADARWRGSDEAGHWTDFEPPDGFEEYGIGVHVLEPGHFPPHAGKRIQRHRITGR